MKLKGTKFVDNINYNDLIKVLPSLKSETFVILFFSLIPKDDLKNLFAETDQVLVAGAFTKVGFISILRNAIQYFGSVRHFFL
jgi:hypothetical protein